MSKGRENRDGKWTHLASRRHGGSIGKACNGIIRIKVPGRPSIERNPSQKEEGGEMDAPTEVTRSMRDQVLRKKSFTCQREEWMELLRQMDGTADDGDGRKCTPYEILRHMNQKKNGFSEDDGKEAIGRDIAMSISINDAGEAMSIGIDNGEAGMSTCMGDSEEGMSTRMDDGEGGGDGVSTCMGDEGCGNGVSTCMDDEGGVDGEKGNRCPEDIKGKLCL
ncbi:hypothetical protein EI94DRAFT_1698081 [Lactarius quietus]|nr:hypothetical protein EI94DRAFT_1698081 [Lactarius quietus]